jgi:hypothetical protein
MTCTTDAFEEEGEVPVVLFDLEVLASEGGSVNTSSGSFSLVHRNLIFDTNFLLSIVMCLLYSIQV